MKHLDSGYARCKACDTKFYPKYHRDTKKFEELCWKCLPIARSAAAVDPILYISDQNGNLIAPYAWSPQETQGFLGGFLMDKLGLDSGDLWQEDEYLAYGEGAFGDLGLFDSYGH